MKRKKDCGVVRPWWDICVIIIKDHCRKQNRKLREPKVVDECSKRVLSKHDSADHYTCMGLEWLYLNMHNLPILAKRSGLGFKKECKKLRRDSGGRDK